MPWQRYRVHLHYILLVITFFFQDVFTAIARKLDSEPFYQRHQYFDKLQMIQSSITIRTTVQNYFEIQGSKFD